MNPRAFHAAELYYLHGLSQKEIAQQIQVERSTVSRILDRLQREGYVQVRIFNPFREDAHLQEQLRLRFGLRDARVVPVESAPRPMLRRMIGMAAARFLSEEVAAGATVGIGWGSTVTETVAALTDVAPREVTVVPLMGGVSSLGPEYQVHDLARRLADLFGGQLIPLYSPTILDSPALVRALLTDPGNRAVTERWNSLDLALVGIGPEVSQAPMATTPYVRQADIEELEVAGAVGDVCCRYLTETGQECDVSISRRLMSIPLEALRRTPTVIGVAGGTNKTRAILAALRGRFVNCLITDSETARALLASAGDGDGGAHD